MAQNITIAGNQYPSVPAIEIPKTGGGGNATFTDTSPTTASASDVAQGKIFFDSTGSQQTGTATGGGGGGYTLLGTLSVGEVITSSQTAVDLGKSINIEGYSNYDLLIVEVVRKAKAANRHYSTITMVELQDTTGAGATSYIRTNGHSLNYKYSSNNVLMSTWATSAYGIYVVRCTEQDGTLNIVLYARYSSTNTGTINGEYDANVYGLKLFDIMT